MHLSIEGDEATFKTTMAYTAPLPIIGFAFDLGSERAIYGSKYNDYFKGLDVSITNFRKPAVQAKDIHIWEYPKPVQLNPGKLLGYKEIISDFMKRFTEAVTSSPARTIVVDTMTLFRSNAADAYLEELQITSDRKQLVQIEWKTPNNSTESVWDFPKSFGKNFVGVHHLKDDYKEIMNSRNEKESFKTGTKSLDGLGNTYRIADVVVRNVKDKSKVKTNVVKCGYNVSLEGQSYEDCTWDLLVGIISGSLEGRLSFDRRAAEE